MADPIELGSFLFTLVEPHRGREVDYNRWYERDHFYAGCMIGAYQFAGDRFVSTRRHKALRTPDGSSVCPDPTSGSYLAVYWVLAGHHDDWNRWAVDQVTDLHAGGRMFTERDHIHTAVYDFSWSHRLDEWGTSAELALDRDYPGIVVQVVELTDGTTHEQFADWCRGEWAPRAMADPAGPDLVVAGTPLPLLDDAPPDVPRMPNADRRVLQIQFCEHDPADGWEAVHGRYAADVAASGLATSVWSSPFIQTVFGTDRYTGELW